MKKSKDRSVVQIVAGAVAAVSVTVGAATAQAEDMMGGMMDNMMPAVVEQAESMVMDMTEMRADGMEQGHYMNMMRMMPDSIERMSRMSSALERMNRSSMMRMGKDMRMMCMSSDMEGAENMGMTDAMMMDCRMMGHMSRMQRAIGGMATMMMDAEMRTMKDRLMSTREDMSGG